MDSRGAESEMPWERERVALPVAWLERGRGAKVALSNFIELH